MKVLLIDDTLTLLTEIKDILMMEGFEVITASDGLDGLTKASINKPDVIITDISMPAMNGYELIEKIRSIDKFSPVPIIVLSAHSSQEHMDRAYNLRADKYLPKPCSSKDLIEAVKEVIRNYS